MFRNVYDVYNCQVSQVFRIQSCSKYKKIISGRLHYESRHVGECGHHGSLRHMGIPV